MAAPALDGVVRRGAVDHGQNAGAIQLDERGVLELGARMGPRAGRDRFEQILAGQFVEELVQVALDGLHGLLQGKEHDDGKGELALPGEILGAHPMARDERVIAQLATQRFDESDDMAGDGFEHGRVAHGL